MIMVNIPEFLS